MSRGTVATRAGLVRGTEGAGCWCFFGLRYAAAPTGASRFAAPRPVEPWSGVRDATQFGPIAPQPTSGIGSYLPGDPLEQSEDCLSLNIWTPNLDASAPVFVFVHGGAFLNGSGASVMYRADALARQGVVVVTCNYRLGAIGFLAHRSLAGPERSFANRGVLDQLAMLGWVQENIAAFGGDPARVTLAGESAGAMVVADLCSLAQPRQLFMRAVLESGATLASSIEEAEGRATRFAELCGLAPSRLDQLESAPLAELLAAQDALIAEVGGAQSMPFRPVVDGAVFPVHPDTAIAAGASAGIDLLIGTNRDEFRLFTFGQPSLKELDDEALGELVAGYLEGAEANTTPQSVIDRYRSARAGRGEAVDPKGLFEAIGSDLVFRLPQLRLADAHVRNGGNAHLYRFDWPSPFANGALGSCHALELPFVFGTIDNPLIALFTGSGAEATTLSETIRSCWARFAASGDPESATDWPRYEPQQRWTRIFGGPVNLESAPAEEERAFFEVRLPAYGRSARRGATSTSDGEEHAPRGT